jgi:glycosyltransferase involved in cell wall biosynthesis
MNASEVPALSVVIPTFNYGGFIADAIRSVLVQEIQAVEIVVADDGSEDDTAEVVGTFGSAVKYVRQERGGSAAARNLGLRHATGRHVAFLDSDDCYVPGALKTQLQCLLDSPEADAVYGKMAQVNDAVFQSAVLDPAPWMAVSMPCWLAGGIIFRDDLVRRIGVFDETQPSGEFLDWVTRGRDLGAVFKPCDLLVMMRRIHGSNKMLTLSNPTAGFGRLLQQHLARKRAKEGGTGIGAQS